MTRHAGTPALQAPEQGDARPVDELQAGELQAERPMLAEDGFACHA